MHSPDNKTQPEKSSSDLRLLRLRSGDKKQNSYVSVRIQERASRESCLIQKLSQALPPRINTLRFGTFLTTPIWIGCKDAFTT